MQESAHFGVRGVILRAGWCFATNGRSSAQVFRDLLPMEYPAHGVWLMDYGFCCCLAGGADCSNFFRKSSIPNQNVTTPGIEKLVGFI